MAMAVNSTYTGQSGAAIDVFGKAFILLRNALIASGLYRQQGAGDGLSAVTTGTTDIFTANAGLGYKTSGAWSTAVANSFSNALAWYRMQAIDGSGNPTGFEFQVQRGNATTAGSDRFNVIGFAPAGFTGTPTATSPYTTGTQQFLFGTTSWNSAGVNMLSSGTPYLGGSGTHLIDIWFPNAGSTGDKAPPFAVRIENATAANGGMVFFVEKLVNCASAEAHPYVVAAGTATSMTGDLTIAGGGVAATFGENAQGMYTLTPAGAINLCCFARIHTPDSTAGVERPNGATAIGAEAGGKYPIERLKVWVDTANVQLKGQCESLRHLFPPSTGYLQRTTFYAATPDPVELPRFSMGQILFPWAVGLVAGTNRTDIRDMFAGAVADTTAPVISAFTPAAGAISATQAITVSATDSATLARVIVSVDYSSPDRHELAFNGLASAAGYDGDYDAASTVTPIAGGHTYSIVPDAGWRGAFTLRVTAIDAGGNQTVSTQAYTMSASSQPATSNVSPTASSAIAATQALGFRVSDPTGLLMSLVYVQFASGQRELVWDGATFAAAYSTSTRTQIVAGKTYDYNIVRVPGWPSAPTIVVKMIDTDGNVVTSSWGYALSASELPSITLIVPPAGAAIPADGTVAFRVSDETGMLRDVVSVEYPDGTREVVWDGNNFTAPFSGVLTARAKVAAFSYDFIVNRTPGWPAAPTFIVALLDVDGNTAETTWSYTLTVSSEPQVTISPASPINEAAQVTIDITDATNLAMFFISAQYESGGVALIWDGEGLADGFLAYSSESVIAGGHRVQAVPDGGWTAGFILKVKAIDSSGNITETEATYALEQPEVIPGPIPGESLGPEYTPRSDIVERAQSRLLEQFRL